jgi:hypothetical protein
VREIQSQRHLVVVGEPGLAALVRRVPYAAAPS